LHHPIGDGVDRGPHIRRQPTLGQHGQLAQQVGGHHRPARRGHPRGGAFDDQLGESRGIERGIDRADDVEQRVAPFETAAKGMLKHAQALGEVKAGRGARTFSGSAQFRSALPGRPDRVRQGRGPRFPIGHVASDGRCSTR
jgi:hypothetical protein